MSYSESDLDKAEQIVLFMIESHKAGTETQSAVYLTLLEKLQQLINSAQDKHEH